MTTPQPKLRTFHPAAVAIFVVGIAVLIVGVIRVHFFSDPAQRSASQTSRAREPGPMRIVVTIPPLMWVAKSLAPVGSDVIVLSPPGAGCESLELTPSGIESLHRADLVLRVGLGIDDSISPLVSSISGKWHYWNILTFPESLSYQPEREGLDQRRANPHVWLDPLLMKLFIQGTEYYIRSMAASFSGSSESAEQILAAAAHCMAECDAIDAEYRLRLGAADKKEIITFHDAFDRLADRYGLTVAAVIQHTHDAEPSPADLADAVRIIKEKGVKAIFIEPQLNPAAAQRIAEITGVKVLTLDPLGDGDWPAMMRKNLDALVEGLNEK